VSAGVASHPGDGRTATQLIATADARLYRIKRSGGQGVAEQDEPAEAGAPAGEGIGAA
jgi:GGDEF domain-containing protein